jgi:hypothetical protein
MKRFLTAVAVVMAACLIYSSVPWKSEECGIILPSVPGNFCLKRDDAGHMFYENKHYKIYIK